MRAGISIPLLLLCALWIAPQSGQAASLVIDAGSGAVLQAEDANRPWYPASLTKLMTLYLVFAALRDGELQPEQELTVSAQAAAQPASKLWLEEGQSIAVETAVRAVIVRSANDAAVVLAEALAGNEGAFADRMTAKARELGMQASRFRNASGLPDPGQVTTARDMALLARAIIREFPHRYALFAEQRFRFRGKSYRTTNNWMRSFAGGEGLKTGFTCASGYNLVAAASRDGRRLIGVVLGDRSGQGRDDRMAGLMERAFEQTSTAESPTLASLAESGDGGSAPRVLSDSECGAIGARSNGRLVGWGVLFGSFPSKAEARAVIEQNRKTLRPLNGRAAVVPSQRWGVQRHAALLVGLKRADAGAACRRLRDSGAYCQALSPQILNDPRAIWR